MEDGIWTSFEAEYDETPGIGDVAINQIMSDMLLSQTTDVDCVAGATVSSKAFIEAVKNALSSAAAPSASVYAKTVGEYFGSAYGFAGPVNVTVSVAGGTICDIAIGDESFCETPGFGAKAQEWEFQEQFIGKTLPVTLADIDAIAGATVTTAAVLNAINSIVQ